MADQKPSKPSILQKALAATDAWFDMQIQKGRNQVEAEIEDEADFFYRKSVAKDQNYLLGTQGYQEKPYRLTFEHLKQMSLKDSIISAIIQTRQNQVSNFSKLVRTNYERGFKINLKDEQKLLEEIKEELKKSPEFAPKKPKPEEKAPGKPPVPGAQAAPNPENVPEPEEADQILDQAEDQVQKASEILDSKDQAADSIENAPPEPLDDSDATEDHESQQVNWRLERRAREELQKKYAKRRRAVEEYIQYFGKTKDRPFGDKRWNFDSVLRAIIRDSYTYDQFGIECVPDQANKPHHHVPVDGATIRYASPELGRYKSFPLQSSYDILYPEKELEALNQKDALELDPKLLEANSYKWVQVVRGRIERAFTETELKVGMRNPTSDIFNNGYAVCELELLVNLVSSHLNTEFYNQAYFSQGFSAKGILHIKAPLNRRKIETIRQQWQHMIKGSRNSFQTPIFAGMDEVNWIPLTQNHSDIEFQGWLQYLIKMICAIYQIDPQEIGIGMKEEGSKGSGLSGDNTQEKIDLSRDKGLYPLLRFLENFINMNVVDVVDDSFFLEFVGLKDESMADALKRQKDESEFKKTVNELRAEDGLPPLPGMDDFIMSPTYFQWFDKYSEKGMKALQDEQASQMTQGIMGEPGEEKEDEELPEGSAEPHVVNQLENQSGDAVNQQIEQNGTEDVQKSIKIEYYQLRS